MQLANNSLNNKIDSSSTEYSNPLQLPRQITISLTQTAPHNTDISLMETLLGEKRLNNLSLQTYIQKRYIESSSISDEGNLYNHIEGNYYDSCNQSSQRTKQICNDSFDPETPLVVTTQLIKTADGRVEIQGQQRSIEHIPGVVFDDSYVIVAKDDASFRIALEIVNNISSRYHIDTGNLVSVSYRTGNDNLIKSLIIINDFSGIIAIMVAVTVMIGGLNILVSVTGGLFERKRSFIGLRILGASIGMIAKSLLIEVIVPLVTLSAITVSLGIFCSYHILHAMGVLSGSLTYFSLPGIYFWIGICAAIAICTVVSMLSIPLLLRLSDYTKIRTE